MADEKVNVSAEESKTPEAPAPSGPGDPPAPEHTEGPAVPGGAQAAPAHAEPSTPEQSVIPGMGEDVPAPSGKVINLSDIQAADKGGKEASAPAPDKKAPEADKPPKRRGRPPKEQAGPTAEKRQKRRSPAQAARLRLTRRPVRRLRPLFGTKCPEVRKPTRARKRAPAVRLRLNPLRR